MHRGLTAEIRRLGLYGAICIIFGLINGHLAWTLVVGALLYTAKNLWQLSRLDAWLLRSSRNPQPPPEAEGIWGNIFDNIYRLQRRHRKERRRQQQVITRMQETTAAFTDGVVVVDTKGNIDWWNTAAESLLGLQNIDQGHALVNFIRHPRFVHYFESGEYADPLILPSSHHDSKKLQYQINRFGQGERLIVVRDVTRLFKLEDMRKDFVANASHEMRTPLTVIRGYLETLADTSYLPPVWQKAVTQMQQQGERMTALVNDLITLSKLETDDPGRDQACIPIAALLRMIKSDAEAFSAGKGHSINLHCSESSFLRGSEKELRSAFSNLVFNAVKYSPANTEIEISFKLNENGAQFTVQDQGSGIDPIHIPRLTERFYRVDKSRSIASGGTGLGLAIVKHVMLRHDGELLIKSQLGEGSTFTCHFPKHRHVNSPEDDNDVKGHSNPAPIPVSSSQNRVDVAKRA